MVIGIDASRGFVDQPTGTERYSFELIRRIVSLPGASVHSWVLYVRPGTTVFNYSFPQNVRIVLLPWTRLWTQGGLAVKTWTDGLDVLWVPAHTLPVLRKPGIRTVVTVHGIEYEWLPAYENRIQRWYLPLSTQYAVATASHIIAVSHFTKHQLIERLGAQTARISVIHEGFTQTEGSKDDPSVFARYSIHKHEYLLFIGTIQPRKNLNALVQGFELLVARPEYSHLRLVIGGKLGWGYESLLSYIDHSPVKGKIIITGYLSEAERYTLLRYAIVYVQPSITEGFGLPVLEAWSEEVPVVSSEGGALREVVGDAGILYRPDDVDGLVAALNRLLSRVSLRRQLIARGKVRMKEFTWDTAASATLQLLTSPRV